MKRRIDVDATKHTGVWVELAPGLSFGCREYPPKWRRWLLKKLLGWEFRLTREPVK